MRDRYLLDTNIASFLIREETQVVKRFHSVPPDQVFISVITEAELLFGIARKPEAVRLQRLVRRFLEASAILEWNSAAAAQFAEARATLERNGELLADMDMMIAAHALAEDAVLVTNVAAFRRIDRLRIEDWTQYP
jgi:tRNA(fMet)-specific endonuclease VapC